MKIMVNALSARQGGGQTYLLHLLENFPKESQNTVYIIAPDSLKVPTGNKNIERVILPDYLVNNPFMRALWERFVFPKILKKMNINILFCPGGLVPRRVPSTCKVITTFQNMLPFSKAQRQKYPFGYMRFRNWILEKLLLRSLIRSDFVIFISEYAKSVIEKRSLGKVNRSIVIPHGVDPRFRRTDPIPAAPSWLPSEGYLLYVSILDVYKAQVEVVEAYAILKSKGYKIPKLYLIGPEYAPYGCKVRETIAKNSLTKDVIIIGAIPNSELPALYQNALANIFASETENCPFILLEALAAGRPLLSSNMSPMPEFGGDAAIYFDPNRPNDLAQKLEDLLGNAQMMSDMSNRAFTRSLDYNWDLASQKTWQAIENLV
jgi:glycosyltransferase involved in cell wall biosynthesis